MNTYVMELRRSAMRWWFPLLVLLDLATLFGRARWWIGEWPQTSVEAQIPAFYLGPFLAAAAAWAASRTRRARLEGIVAGAARPAWQIESAQLAATLAYGLGAYAVGAVVAAITTAAKNDHGSLWPGYFLEGTALLVGCAAIGHASGKWSRTQFFAPVACSLGMFVAIAWLGSPSSFGLYLLSGPPFLRVAPPAVVSRLALAAALVAAALSFRRPSVRRRIPTWSPRRRQLKGAALMAMPAVCAVVLAVAGPVQVPRPASDAPTCTTGAPVICLWPEDSVYLPTAQKMADRMRNLASYGFVVPARFDERGLERAGSGGFDFYILEGSMWDASESMASEIQFGSRPHDCPLTTTVTSDQAVAIGEQGMWLAMTIFGGARPSDMHGGPPGVDLDAVARVVQEPSAVQRQWLNSRMVLVRQAYCG